MGKVTMSEQPLTNEMISRLHDWFEIVSKPELYQAISVWLASVEAEAWDEGARWGAVEFQTGVILLTDESQVQLADGDNPYRGEQAVPTGPPRDLNPKFLKKEWK